MEITARDLRIGNYVNYRIQDDLDERKDWLECSVIDANDLVILESGIDCDYQPIPLTEEWLLRFGFEKYDFMNGFFVKLKDRHLMVQFYKSEIHIFFTKVSKDSQGHWMKGRDYFIDKNSILYLHTFQNLIFALTQTELTISK